MAGSVLRDWRAFSKNTLRGFATIELPSGLVIHDISIHEKNGKWWAAMPAAPQLENGQHRFLDGKGQYKRILEWRDRGLSDKFSEVVVGLVRSQHSLT